MFLYHVNPAKNAFESYPIAYTTDAIVLLDKFKFEEISGIMSIIEVIKSDEIIEVIEELKGHINK